MLFLIQLETLSAAFAAMALCWLRFDLMPIRTSRVFSAKLPSSLLASSMSWCMWLFLPGCSTFYLTLLSFMRFLFACISTRYMTDISATPHSFVSSINLPPSSHGSPSHLLGHCEFCWPLSAAVLFSPQVSCKEGAHLLLSQP